MVFRLAAPAVDILVKYTGVADPQVGDDEACVGLSALASTRATIRSTRLQLAAPSKNSLKRPVLPSFGAASKRAFVLASRPSMCRRNVVVGATPRI